MTMSETPNQRSGRAHFDLIDAMHSTEQQKPLLKVRGKELVDQGTSPFVIGAYRGDGFGKTIL